MNNYKNVYFQVGNNKTMYTVKNEHLKISEMYNFKYLLSVLKKRQTYMKTKCMLTNNNFSFTNEPMKNRCGTANVNKTRWI